jgi:hypothetical protein
VASGNLVGFSLGNGAQIKDSAATGNGTGFLAADRTHLSHCIATVNTSRGFNCSNHVTLIDCTASRNSNDGILALASCSILRCNSSRNLPIGSGIVTGAGCTITDCTVGANPISGINAGDGSTVRNCTARGNADGIEAGNNCLILENTCSENTGYGIVSFFTGSRVEGNSCNLNGALGFYLPGSDQVLTTKWARLDLLNSSATGSGPDGATVTLQFALTFTRKSAGHAYGVELAASDDLGHTDAFTRAGTIYVECARR